VSNHRVSVMHLLSRQIYPRIGTHTHTRTYKHTRAHIHTRMHTMLVLGLHERILCCCTYAVHSNMVLRPPDLKDALLDYLVAGHPL